ncbi:LacI family DNA-binding transcriptional regulator [Megasphaera sueciensis]|jgi:LacI family transcriptional regulator/LacI family asc operon transcriptional repressor|uniref:LacI family DNA-binding transcriptional regulator n=1 Tax=Megasphaera sueciensis TaxID=349094 RepID=UPI003D046AD2
MTIYDIAKKCNVSIATVSRVLNGSDRVSEKTRAKVLAAIKEQDYAPNPFARGLGLDSMKMVGVLCSDVADAFYAKAVSLIEHALQKHNFDVMLSCTGESNGKDIKALRYLMQKHVDAVIIIGTPFAVQGNAAALKKIAEQIPLVAINNNYKLPGTYSIICDEQAGMRNAVYALSNTGCRSILYLYDALTYSGRHKLNGYKQGVLELGLDTQPALTQKTPRTFEAVAAMIHRLLKQKVPFDAILASEDILAVAAQRIARRNNHGVPVIGCNNSIIAECATPTLTSLDNRLDRLCETAIKTIIQLMQSEAPALPSKTVFDANLIERESFQTHKQ